MNYKIKVLFISVVVVLICATSALASQFVELMRDDQLIIMVDVESIRDKGDYVVAWSKWIPRGRFTTELKKLYKANVSNQMTFDAYNKSEKQTQTLVEVAYFTNGQFRTDVNRQYNPYAWKEVIPRTYNEFIYNFIMDATNNS